MGFVKEEQVALFEMVYRAETLYYVAEGEKSRLATELMGTIYNILEELNLLDTYHDWRIDRLELDK